MGFFGKLLHGIEAVGGVVGAPFTGGASLALTGAGINGLVGDFSKKNSGTASSSSPSPSSQAYIDSLIKQSSAKSDTLSAAGSSDKTKGAAALDPSMAYLMKILSNDSNAVGEASAPANATILSQYDTARRAVADLPGRGGAKGEKIAESYFSQASDMTRTLETIRPDAAKQLSAMGLDLSKLGLSEEELSQSGLLDIIRSLTSANTAKRGQNLQTYSDLGNGIGKIISSLLLGGGNKGGGGGSDPFGGGSVTTIPNGGADTIGA